MSGLVSFFKDFFPNVQNIDYSRRLEDLTADERGLAASSASARKKKQQREQQQRRKHDDDDGDNKDPSLERLLRVLSKPPRTSLVEYTPPSTFQEWQNYCQESLSAFYRRRLESEEDDDDDQEEEEEEKDKKNGLDDNDDGDSDVNGEDDDDYDDEQKDMDIWESDSEAESDDDDKDDDKGGEKDEGAGEDDENDNVGGGNALALESQPPLGLPEQAMGNCSKHNSSKPSVSRKRHLKHTKRRIPALSHAIHSIQTLEYLDLRTLDLSLTLAQVHKIWRLRDTKRGFQYLMDERGGGSVTTRCVVFPGRMPRVLMEQLEDDGPMASTYDFVLSMEVEQLLPSPKARPHGGTPRKSIVRIFLYNSYAKAVSEWMEDQRLMNATNTSNKQQKPGILLSLFKIPALSIFPYALDPRDWWDQEHVVKYCLCIGDGTTKFKTMDPQTGRTTEVRADSDDMEMRLVASSSLATMTTAVSSNGTNAARDKKTSELVLSKRIIEGPLSEVEGVGMEDDAPPEGESNVAPAASASCPLLESWQAYLASKASSTATASATGTSTATATPTTEQQTATAQQETHLQQQHAPISENRLPVIPNFSIATTSAPTVQAPSDIDDGQASTREPQGPIVPPERPPPPPPVNMPSVDPMEYQGPARKRPRIVNSQSSIRDVTNLPSVAAAGPTLPSQVQYTPLSSLRAVYNGNLREDGRFINFNLAIHVYAVVFGFSTPHQTKRGDWMVSVTLVDETCTLPVTLNIFTKTMYALPQLTQMGDVIRLHRVHVKMWNENIQLTGQKATSYVIIRKKTNNQGATPLEGANTADGTGSLNWVVIPTATSEYSFDAYDEQRSQNLWHWGQKLLREQPTLIHQDHRFTIADKANVTDEDSDKASADRDLTVVVTSKFPFPPDAQTSITPRGFLRVWDGTGHAPSDPLPLQNSTEAVESIRTGDPPSEVVVALASVIAMYKASADDTDAAIAQLEAPQALCGKVANVVIWETAHWEFIQHHVPIGTFIRLRNVGVRSYNNHNFRSIFVHPKSWLTPMPVDAFEVRALLLDHDYRIKRREYNPQSGVLPLSREEEIAMRQQPQTRQESCVDKRPGNGLANFVSSAAKKLRVSARKSRKTGKKRRMDQVLDYKGIVRLSAPAKYGRNLASLCVGTPPTYRFQLTVSDESDTSLQVIVTSPLADKLLGVSAATAAQGEGWRDPLFVPEESCVQVTLRMLIRETKQFFVMKDIHESS